MNEPTEPMVEAVRRLMAELEIKDGFPPTSLIETELRVFPVIDGFITTRWNSVDDDTKTMLKESIKMGFEFGYLLAYQKHSGGG